MSERWARTLLTAYRWAGVAAMPFIGLYVLSRVGKGKEDRARRHERYGQPSRERPDGPLVWVHAASVGETAAVLGLIDRILRTGIYVLLTTGTVTSARVVSERLGDRVIHQFVPLDLQPAVSRFLSYWKPDLAIVAESEVWPVTILELGARRIPQVLVNARMSDRSFERWQKAPFVAEALFENFAHVIAQSETDGDRFRTLGARPITVAGNLKGDTEPPPVDDALLDFYLKCIGNRKTWAAISTHEGEEQIAAQVHKALRTRHPDVLSIIVPRHPHRAEALVEDLTGRGLRVVTRSSGQPVTPDTDVFLGDSIGEMGLYLRLTEIAFVGRSLAGEGGQNPMEPAMLNTAVLSGTNVQNFREAYRLLIEKGGARLVKDAKMLAGAVHFLLENHAAREAMMRAGLEAVQQMSGSLSRTLTALEPFLHPLIVKSRLQGGR